MLHIDKCTRFLARALATSPTLHIPIACDDNMQDLLPPYHMDDNQRLSATD